MFRLGECVQTSHEQRGQLRVVPRLHRVQKQLDHEAKEPSNDEVLGKGLRTLHASGHTE